MALPTVHGQGRIVGDPELRYTPSGKAVLQMRLAANRRRKDEHTGQWENTAECWLNATLWEQAAEEAGEVLRDKDLVVYLGQLETRSYERRDGTRGLAVDVRIDTISKVPPRQNAQQGGGAAPAADAAGGFDTGSDEPPF